MIARVRNYTYRRRRRHYHRRNAENEELTLAGLMRKRTHDESCAADAVDEGVGKFIHAHTHNIYTCMFKKTHNRVC